MTMNSPLIEEIWQQPLSIVDELVQLTTQLATERDLERLLGAIVATAARLANADVGRVFTLDRSMREMRCAVSRHKNGESAFALDPISIYADGERYNLTDAHVFATVTGRIVSISDVYRYTGYEFNPIYTMDRRSNYRTRSFVTVPLSSVKGVTLGVLQLVNLSLDGNETTPLPVHLERLVRTVAAFAAVAIDIARLFDENRGLIRQLDRKAEELERENARLKSEVNTPGTVGGIIAESASMKHAIDLLMRAASSPKVTVLLLGETGTGKDLFAKAVHESSVRRSRPLVVQNCAALPEHLMESELFGYRKGAFTGAVADKKGLFQEADGGTLFLDEIGDMPFGLQAKVLRVLEDGEVRRVGDTRAQRVDVRVIAATHVDLPRRISDGCFREDLFYRLSVFPIRLPPLRERASDLPRLIEHFLLLASQAHGRHAVSFTARALDALSCWTFPGNVRELKNIVERAVLLLDEGERIDLRHLPPEIVAARPAVGAILPSFVEGHGLKSIMQGFEARVIEAKLNEVGWNQSRAADLLMISRRSLVEKLGRYNIRPPKRI
jgi:sigma-54-dependent transcriptional regulator